MQYVTASSFLPRLAATAMVGSLLALAGCDMGGSDKGAMAPPPKVEGLAKTQQDIPPITATSTEDYNAQMKKRAEELQKHPSQYPDQKK